MALGDRLDPYGQFNFLIEVEGVARAAFTEASGLTTEQETIDYRDGSERAVVRKLPGLETLPNVALKRGLTQDSSLWLWRKTTLDGVTERRSFSVVVLNEARAEVLRFDFREGWICKWEGPQLNSTTNDAAIEGIEISHEGIEWKL